MTCVCFVIIRGALKRRNIRNYVDNSQYRLYSLIWKRTVATQMATAKIANTTYKISAGEHKEFEFTSKGQRIIFAGFMKLNRKYFKVFFIQNL